MRPHDCHIPRIRRAVVDLAWAHLVWDGDGQQAGTLRWPDLLRGRLGADRGETLLEEVVGRLRHTVSTLTLLAP